MINCLKRCSLLITIIVIGQFSCSPISQSRFQHPIEYVQLANKSIHFYDRHNSYEKIKTISYKKDYRLYTNDGVTESSVTQMHHYNLTQGQYLIKSDNGSEIAEYQLLDHVYQEKIKGEWQSSERAQKIINAAMYVTSMPWNFMTESAVISVADANNSLRSITMDYDHNLAASRTSSDRWIYYMTPDGEIVHQVAYSPDHISLVENLESHDIDGFKFIKHRKSYRVDSLHKKQYLRADYDYYDYKIGY